MFKTKIYLHAIDTKIKQQATVIEKILTIYNKKEHVVALLYGEPASGKSMTGLLLTQKLKSVYCNTYKPWDTNSSLSYLYVQTNPTKEKPLVLIFDEFDSILKKIHEEKIHEIGDRRIAIKTKGEINLFFDEIQRGIFPYLIVILTTNKDPQYINDMDPSYIRRGRVDLIAEFKLQPEVLEKFTDKQEVLLYPSVADKTD